ncbi:phenylacetate--CoA ligase family protein [Simplicispira suum]|uniref:CoF synthetase n=1 Tax=Simplicispira suum TaxID=2109915 RepID=A0A2S0N082_9BURK|nr:phenylacetate--CoA ligase family protein [Simplicispira suum]AVO41548.1 CoF synthetase [Simplicispira suum]MBW7832886.1 phenylacetate--CoA ligase family protein [Simplicispira suum]
MSAVFDALRLSAVSLDVSAAQRGTPQGIAQRQQTRLAALLNFTLRGSRLYRSLWPAGTTPGTALEQLPVVTRSQLMAHFDDWVTDPQLQFDALRAFTADPARIAEPWLDRYMVWESSGTSGQPGIFVQDAQAMAVYDALEALRRSPPPKPLISSMWDPLGLGERTAFIGAIDGHFASTVSVRRLCAINPWLAHSTRSFSLLQPLGALVQALNAFAPTAIATYPTAAALLADEAARGALHIRPREIWTGGEYLAPAMRAHIARQLGAAVRNSYGASEFLAIGWECAHGQMHVNADWVILEPVDEHLRPVPAGQPSSSVLLTNLANHVQPLVRYDLGDQVSLLAERCRCGSPLPVLQVQGRHDEPLVMCGQGGRRATLLPLALSTVLEDNAGVFDFTLRQIDACTLELHLPQEGDEGHQALARCCAELQAFAIAMGVGAIQVHGKLGQSTPRGRSGKSCRIVACAKT